MLSNRSKKQQGSHQQKKSWPPSSKQKSKTILSTTMWTCSTQRSTWLKSKTKWLNQKSTSMKSWDKCLRKKKKRWGRTCKRTSLICRIRWMRKIPRSKKSKERCKLSRIQSRKWLDISGIPNSSCLLLRTCIMMKKLSSMRTMSPSSWLNLKSILLCSSPSWLIDNLILMLPFLHCHWRRWHWRNSIETPLMYEPIKINVFIDRSTKQSWRESDRWCRNRRWSCD